MIVPPLLKILRSHHISTTLRTSSISLLAECESTNSLAMVPYLADLANAMVDLLQLETVPANPRSTPPTSDVDDQTSTMDSEPTSSNSKFPPLRRAALHLLALVIRETTKQIYDSSFGQSLFSDGLMTRAKATLSYISSVDQDNVVRVMAREVDEALKQMQRAIIGL